MEVKRQYNLGMFGAGNVAREVSNAIKLSVKRIVLYGVASRKLEKSRKFAEDFGCVKAFASYEEMLECDELDIIYISTPTKYHYEHIKMCLMANKHVICEKAFCISEKQSKKIYQLAREKKRILMDGLWTMYMPSIKKMAEILSEAKIGKLKNVSASFGYPIMDNPSWIIDDLAIYSVSALYKFAGANFRTSKIKRKKEKGNLISIKGRFLYDEYRGKVKSGIKHRTSYLLCIRGTKGIILSRRWWRGKGFILWRFPFFVQRLDMPHEVNGYEWEFIELVKMLDSGKLVSDTWSDVDSNAVMHMMDMVCEY